MKARKDLPEGAGEFEHYSWDGDRRLCSKSVRKETQPTIRAGFVRPKTVSINVLTLPNGKKVDIEEIGKGHATVAYKGSDGWVYLVTSDESGDKSKEILSDMNKFESGRVWAESKKHIPYVEEVGFLRNRGVDTMICRMPLYHKLSASNKKSWKDYRDIEKFFYLPPSRSVVEFVNTYPEDSDRVRGVSASISASLIHLASFLMNYGDDFVFDIHRSNLARDDNDNLILLDVFVDSKAHRSFLLKKQREKNLRR